MPVKKKKIHNPEIKDENIIEDKDMKDFLSLKRFVEVKRDHEKKQGSVPFKPKTDFENRITKKFTPVQKQQPKKLWNPGEIEKSEDSDTMSINSENNTYSSIGYE